MSVNLDSVPCLYPADDDPAFFAAAVQNFAPPIWPLASRWNRWTDAKMMPRLAFIREALPRFTLRTAELAAEQAADRNHRRLRALRVGVGEHRDFSKARHKNHRRVEMSAGRFAGVDAADANVVSEQTLEIIGDGSAEHIDEAVLVPIVL